MDNHGSHCTEEFIEMANKNMIRPYPLIAHCAHCMQPLDVGCFRSFTHWYQEAIHNSMIKMDLDYGISHFMKDLQEIRQKTFTKWTIRHAFRDSGMYPPCAAKTVQLAYKFSVKKNQGSPT